MLNDMRLPVIESPQWPLSRKWPCICGGLWSYQWADGWINDEGKCAHRSNRRWRGHPGEITPLDQWVAEACPAGRDGFTKANVDLRINRFRPNLGVLDVEAKAHQKEGGMSEEEWVDKHYAETSSMWKVAAGGPRAVLGIVLIQGNTPGPLDHYPDDIGILLPPRPTVADGWQVWQFTADRRVVLVDEGDGPDGIRDLLVRWEPPPV